MEFRDLRRHQQSELCGIFLLFQRVAKARAIGEKVSCLDSYPPAVHEAPLPLFSSEIIMLPRYVGLPVAHDGMTVMLPSVDGVQLIIT